MSFVKIQDSIYRASNILNIYHRSYKPQPSSAMNWMIFIKTPETIFNHVFHSEKEQLEAWNQLWNDLKELKSL